MPEKILVPLDGSTVGETALPVVEDIASKMAPEAGVEVILLHVITSLSHYVIAGDTGAQIPYTDKEIEQIETHVLKYLNDTAENLRVKGITVTTRVATGNAAEMIIRTAREINANLIAMSTHGRSGLSRWALGSVTDKILRSGKLPMLTVRAVPEPVKP